MTRVGRTSRRTLPVDQGHRDLGAELSRRVDGEVRFDALHRAMYSTDASNYRQPPVGVVIPRSLDDVVETVRLCRQAGVAILARGGGTSLAGQSCNSGVVVDFSRHLNRLLDVDVEAGTARVQPGIVLDHLLAATAPHGLWFGPDPATHAQCTLGGMIGNNSCGVHSVTAGKTVDNVEALEILTYDGERMRVAATPDHELDGIIGSGGRRGELYRRLRDIRDRNADEIRARYPEIPRRVSGYNLDQLLPENGFNVARALVGSESTCALVLEATVRLLPSPRHRALVVLGYDDVFEAADHVCEVLEHGPIGLEGVDELLVEFERIKGMHPKARAMLPGGRGWLLAEFEDATPRAVEDRAQRAMDGLERGSGSPRMRLFTDPHEQHMLWLVRESGLGATAQVPHRKDAWPGWEDSAVPPDRLAGYLRDLKALFARYGYEASVYGHFGEGCVHCRIDFDLAGAHGVAAWRRFLDEAADLVVSYGGSLSGEHGDGQARAELLDRMFGARLVRAFEEFKDAWDPNGRMNPGKVVRPYRIDENLRLGAGYRPWEPETHFRFPEDDHRFSRATLRCVGVGKCRRAEGGTMCPSYMVTRDERDSTRGRARVLFEMLQGDVITDGWRSRAVLDALDLCLACKGCLDDCPVNVDMATYKAEFLAHHYSRRLRPAAHYTMGLFPYAARAASRLPRVASAITQAPVTSRVLKRLSGLTPEREIPRFARQSFREWFRARGGSRPTGRRVVLFPDTFTNFLDPGVAVAATEVLEAAGYEIRIPPRVVCCGLPAITNGLLPTAMRMLRRTLETFAPALVQGLPIVGLEPSCTAVLRHDLHALLPGDEHAARLRDQTRTLAELLRDSGWEPPSLHRDALVHHHCHHKAVMSAQADDELIDRMGVRARRPDSGCCGLAGSWGYERGHYDVSMKAGERVLLPAVRETPQDALVVTDGWSCRTQIEHGTGRRALHLAQVLQMALRSRTG